MKTAKKKTPKKKQAPKKKIAKKKIAKKAAAAKKPARKPARSKPATKPVKRASARVLHPYHHATEVVAIGLSPDGQHLATGSFVGEDYEAGGELQIWEVATGRVVNHLHVGGGVGWPDYTGTLQWSPDGRTLAAAQNTNAVALYDPFRLDEPAFDVCDATDGWSRPPSFCWSPDSQRLFISCWRSSWDRRTNKPAEPLTVPDVPGCIVKAGSMEDSLEWMVPGIPTGAWRAPASEDDERHIEPPRELRWSQDHLVALNSHSQLLCIDLSTRTLSWLETAGDAVRLDPTGELLFDGRQPAHLRDATTGAALPWGALPGAFSIDAVWSHDGTRLAIVEGPPEDGDDEDVPPGIRAYAIDRAGRRCTPLGRIAASGTSPVWAPDGRRLAFLEEESTLAIWSLDDPNPIRHPLEEAKGLLWGPSERLIAWSERALHFIDTAPALKVDSRWLLETPADDGPLALEALAGFRSAQFPVGPKEARAWAALFDGVLIVPPQHEAEARAVVGRSDGRHSTPADLAVFATWAEAIAARRSAFPLEVRQNLGGVAAPKTKSFGPSAEPRELFDLYALMEVDAAAATSEWSRQTQSLWLAQLYHRAKKDTEALRSLDRVAGAHEQATARLSLALHSGVRGELDRARRYRESTDPELIARAAQQIPSLIPQIDALLGAVDTLLGKDSRALIEKAAADQAPENNRGEKRAVVARAWLAVEELEKALPLLPGLGRYGFPALSDAVHLGLDAYTRVARASAHDDFTSLAAVVDGFLELGAADAALEALQWFHGLSNSAARARILGSRNPRTVPPAALATPDELAAAIDGLDLDRHWAVGERAAKFAARGDYASAFAVLQRMPKSKRSYAIPTVSMAIAQRIAPAPDAEGLAAVYGLLEVLPAENLGTGGRGYETSRVLRVLEGWPSWEQEGLLS